MVISNSDRSMFKNCRRKWDLGSPNRQNFIPKKKSSPLWLGSLAHECLDMFYGGLVENAYEGFKLEYEKLTDEDFLEFEKEIKLTDAMLKHYSLVYPRLEDEPFEVLGTEIPFQISLGKWAVLAGTFDGVLRWKSTGAVTILEHKTFSMRKDVRLHGIDDQTSLYPAALNFLIKQGKVPGTTTDDFCDTVIYNGLWKKHPGIVEEGKKGGVLWSSAKNMTPQWFKFNEKILGKKLELDVDKADLLQYNLDKYFPRFEIHRGVAEQNKAIERIRGEYAEMSRPDLILYHNPTTECAWKCAFLPVCEAMNAGRDYEQLLRTNYCKAPSRGEAYEKEIMSETDLAE